MMYKIGDRIIFNLENSMGKTWRGIIIKVGYDYHSSSFLYYYDIIDEQRELFNSAYPTTAHKDCNYEFEVSGSEKLDYQYYRELKLKELLD